MRNKIIALKEYTKPDNWLSEYEKAKHKTHYQHKVENLAIPGMETEEIKTLLTEKKIIDQGGFFLDSEGNRAIDQTPDIERIYKALYEYKLDQLALNPPEGSFDVEEELLEDYEFTDEDWDLLDAIMSGTYNSSKDEIYQSNKEYFQDKVWTIDKTSEQEIKSIIKKAIASEKIKIQPNPSDYSWKFPFSIDAVEQMGFTIKAEPPATSNDKIQLGTTTITWKLPKEISRQMPAKIDVNYTRLGDGLLLISSSLDDIEYLAKQFPKKKRNLTITLFGRTVTPTTRKIGNRFVMKTPKKSGYYLRRNMEKFAVSQKEPITPRVHEDRFIIVEVPK